MYTIENEQIRIQVSTKGAELQSLWHKQHALEYLWQGDAAYWAKRSPVLFPIVGTLRNNTYIHQDVTYNLPRHGFARDKAFALHEQTASSITLVLHSDADTLKVYPFAFSFFITYSIEGNTLNTCYKVINTGTDEMYFSVGAHPAFNVPLTNTTHFEDWYLQFNQQENSNRWPITADGLIATTSEPFLQGDRLPLQPSLFYKDALVFKDLASTTITLASDISERRLVFSFEGFPYFGIWSTKDAPFVCLEPWCGIADSEHADGDLTRKEGIHDLAAGSSWQRQWSIAVG